MNNGVTIDDRSFSLMIARLQELRRIEPAKIVRNIGRDYARAAAKRTRLAKKTPWRKYKIVKTGKIEWVKKLPARYPSGRGFARLGWFLALNNLGVKMKNPNPRIEKLAHGNGIWAFNNQDGNSELVAGNKTPYIAKLDSEDAIDNEARQAAYFVLSRSLAKFEQQATNAGR